MSINMRMGDAMQSSRRTFCLIAAAAFVPTVQASGTKTPVILHTDIGGDVDDTFALLWLLRRPELDSKLVVTDSGNTLYKARLAAKLLALANWRDVPKAYGPDAGNEPGAQSAWLGQYPLREYGGPVRPDGAQAIVDTVMASSQPVTIIATGTAHQSAAALRLEPSITRRARFVGMYGSVRVGYGGDPTPVAEINVKNGPAALRAVFDADWPVAITPLDTCGDVVLEGEQWRAFRASPDPFARACVANSEVWLPHAPWMSKDFDLGKTSSVLFDTVAVALAFDDSTMVMETLRLRVTPSGMTVVDPRGRPVRVATAWKDLARFKQRLAGDRTRLHT
jgi:inosine-uridine nucleoside N-ribohydrolase